MDIESIILSEAEKDKHYITYMWNLKNNTNESTYKTETTQIHRKNTCGYQREKGWWCWGCGGLIRNMRLTAIHYYM